MRRPVLYALIPFCIGIFVYCSFPHPLPAAHIGRMASGEPAKIAVKGVIADDPSVSRMFFGGEKVEFTLNVEAVKEGAERSEWQKARGRTVVRIYTKADRRFGFGDEAVIGGMISRPESLKNPGLFDYAKYLENKGIYSVIRANDKDLIEVVTGRPANPVKRLAYRIRRAMRRTLERYLDGPDAAFAKAMLIGDRTGLGDDLNDEFIKTGTVHILSISGLHVGLIAALVLGLLGLAGVPKKVNFAVTLAFLAVYSYIAGSSPPIMRAVIMFAVFAVGYIIERDTDLLNSLAVAALAILIWNPRSLFDPSFQLSFASIASIFLFAPKIDGFLRTDSIGKSSWPGKAAAYALKGVSVSVAAWIGTWPIIAAYFNIASPVSVIANLVVIPISFVSMIAAIALLFAHMASAALANIIAIGMGAVDSALFAVNRSLAGLPMGYFRIPALPVWCVVFYYACVISWANGSKAAKAALIAALVAFNIAVWSEVARLGRDEARITFLDVGQADAAVVQLPGGRTVLVDAGSGGEEGRFDAGRSVVAPYLWNRGVRTIDALIITHPHADHLGGALYVLENFKVGAVMDSGARDDGELYKKYMQLVKEKHIRRYAVAAGDEVIFSPDGKFYVLSPQEGEASSGGDANEGSLVGKFVCKRTGVLFCGDVSSRAMDAAANSYGELLRSDIVKVPHHGGTVGEKSSLENFYSKAFPKVFVISTGAQSHRDRGQIDIINAYNAICYDTSRNGAVTVRIDPAGYTCEPFRPVN